MFIHVGKLITMPFIMNKIICSVQIIVFVLLLISTLHCDIYENAHFKYSREYNLRKLLHSNSILILGILMYMYIYKQ